MIKQTLIHELRISDIDIEGLLLMRTAASLLAEEARLLSPSDLPKGYKLYSKSLEMSNGFWADLEFIKKLQG